MNKRTLLCFVGVTAVLSLWLNAQTPEQAIAFEQRGDFAAATEIWKAVVQRDPQDAAAFAQLGIALSKQQKYQEAASAWRVCQTRPGRIQRHLREGRIDDLASHHGNSREELHSGNDWLGSGSA